MISKMPIFERQQHRSTTSFVNLSLALKMYARKRWFSVPYMEESLLVLTIGEMSVILWMKWALYLVKMILTYGYNLERKLMALSIENMCYCIHMKLSLSWKKLRSFSEKKLESASPWSRSQLVPLLNILATRYPRSQWQMEQSDVALSIQNMSRVLLRMWKTTSIK